MPFPGARFSRKLTHYRSERQPRDLLKPDLNLSTRDIQGAQSWTTSFAKTYSMTNNRLAYKDPNDNDIRVNATQSGARHVQAC